MQAARHGTRSRVSRIRPWAKGGPKPLSRPGCPLIPPLGILSPSLGSLPRPWQKAEWGPMALRTAVAVASHPGPALETPAAVTPWPSRRLSWGEALGGIGAFCKFRPLSFFFLFFFS